MRCSIRLLPRSRHRRRGHCHFPFNQTLEDQLIYDWMVGVVPMLETLLDNYDVRRTGEGW